MTTIPKQTNKKIKSLNLLASIAIAAFKLYGLTRIYSL